MTLTQTTITLTAPPNAADIFAELVGPGLDFGDALTEAAIPGAQRAEDGTAAYLLTGTPDQVRAALQTLLDVMDYLNVEALIIPPPAAHESEHAARTRAQLQTVQGDILAALAAL